ncbi:putative uncharacterized protein [Azospirillum sp. CAG:260]|nr:putative uncharacterized protein [Azospirillum sp. CAG:260]
MKKTNKKMLLINLLSILSLLTAGITTTTAAAVNCTQAPDCASLGYTMKAADCTDGIKVACPTDPNQVFCERGIPSVPCAVGSILGGNQLCYADKLPDNVKPVGIVFDPANRLAVALTGICSDFSGCATMLWSSSYCDTPNLDNCSVGNELSCGTDGHTNTDAILASTCNGGIYAAGDAYIYEPAGCAKDFCKKTKWFLPSIKELVTLYNAKSAVNASLSLTGVTTLYESSYWSSTEYNSYSVWVLNMSSGSRSYFPKTGNNLYVRPVVKY